MEIKCGRGGATIRLAPDGGLTADQDVGSGRVHIRCYGNGHLWFRSYSGSLLEGPKSKQKVLAPTLGTSPRLGVPSLRLESVGRRHGPSLAQDG